MQEILSFNVKYTLGDIRDFSFASVRSRVSNKILFTVAVFLTVILALFVVLFILFPSGDKGLHFLSALLIFIPLGFPILLIWGFTLVPAYLMYLGQRNDFRKSKSLEQLQNIKIFEDRIEILTENGSFSMLWNEIFKVLEFKPGIVIQSSPGKMFLVPRRCFRSQEELNLFIDTIDSKVDRKKTKLKRYRLLKSIPDYGEIKNNKVISQETEKEHELTEPFVKIYFSYTKREYIGLNFRLYFTKPVGLFTTAIGIILLSTSIRDILINGFNLAMPLIFGVALTFVTPISLYKNTIKRFDRDAALQKQYCYMFYDDYYVIEHPSGTNKIRYSDLVKVIENKAAILLFSTTKLAYIIPKRAFKDMGNELDLLIELIHRKVSSKARKQAMT